MHIAGNVTKVKQQKKALSNKEKKKKERLRAAKIKAGEPVSDATWEVEEKPWWPTRPSYRPITPSITATSTPRAPCSSSGTIRRARSAARAAWRS